MGEVGFWVLGMQKGILFLLLAILYAGQAFLALGVELLGFGLGLDLVYVPSLEVSVSSFDLGP